MNTNRRQTNGEGEEEDKPGQRINEIADQHEAWAKTFYVKHGRPTRTLNNIRNALDELRAQWGEEPADDFSPAKLRLVEQAMINSGRLCRRSINDRIQWIRHFFSWAADLELVDESLPHRLDRVRRLKAERPKVQPVLREHVQATIRRAPEMLRVMIGVQWFTGMRPGEVVLMSKQTLSRMSSPWVYEPTEHKTEHWNRQRVIYLGPNAQQVLEPWIAGIKDNWIFPGRRLGRNQTPQPIRVQSYYNAIRRINRSHNLPQWHPHQIRHAAAVRYRSQFGLEAAQAVLGHANARVTEIYAPMDHRDAMRVVELIG